MKAKIITLDEIKKTLPTIVVRYRGHDFIAEISNPENDCATVIPKISLDNYKGKRKIIDEIFYITWITIESVINDWHIIDIMNCRAITIDTVKKEIKLWEPNIKY